MSTEFQERSMLVASVGTLLGQVIRKIGQPNEITDQELLQRYIQQRSQAAFEELMHRHGALVWGVCRRMLSHQQDAEDAFQATFVVLAKKADSVHRPEQLSHWLYGVACYASRNVRKSRTRRANKITTWGDADDVEDHRHAIWSEVSPLVDDELSRLPGKYRLPLVMCCVEGMTHQEAAKLLKWPIGTVAGRISRGRELLRQRLLKKGVMVSSTMMATFLTQEVMAGTLPSALISECVRGLFANSAIGLGSSATASFAAGQTIKQLVMTRILIWTSGIMAVFTVGASMVFGWNVLTAPRAVVQAASQQSNGTSLLKNDPRFVPLPREADAIVLRWSQVDLKDTRQSTELTIRSDGKAETTLRSPDGKPEIKYEQQLSAAEMQKVIQSAVHDQEFFAFDTAKTWAGLLAEYEFEGDMRSESDTLLTEIKLRTAAREHQVQWHQLGSTEVWFHEVKAIRQLSDLQRSLRNMTLVMQAGGKDAVEAVAAPLHAELLQTYPRLPAFDSTHLSHYTVNPDGVTTRWTFSHGSKFGNPRYFSATCDRSANGMLRLVSVIPGPGDVVPKMKRRTVNK